jgi:hypothetical protein
MTKKYTTVAALLTRPLSPDETGVLTQARDAQPGDPIILFVCQEAYEQFPTDHVFTVTVAAPEEWNHLALASIIRGVLLAANEREDAHTIRHRCDFPQKPYIKLQFGRTIERLTRREQEVDHQIPFLFFRTSTHWFTVTLPQFPYEAIAGLIADAALSTEITMNFNLGGTVLHGDIGALGPRPRRYYAGYPKAPQKVTHRRGATTKKGGRR